MTQDEFDHRWTLMEARHRRDVENADDQVLRAEAAMRALRRCREELLEAHEAERRSLEALRPKGFLARIGM